MAFNQAVNLATAGQGNAPQGQQPPSSPQRTLVMPHDLEPPVKRARLDPLFAASLEQELERNRLVDFKRRMEGILLERVKRHPLYAFAVSVAGSSGRGAQLDPLLLFETTEGRRCVEELVSLEQRKSQFNGRLQEIARDTQRLQQTLDESNRTQQPTAPQSPINNPAVLQQQQHIGELRLALAAESQQKNRVESQRHELLEARTIKRQRASAWDSINKSQGINAMRWWLISDNLLGTLPAVQQQMVDLVEAFSLSRTASDKYYSNLFSADQFGTSVQPQIEKVVKACANYLHSEAFPPNFGSLNNEQKRYWVVSTVVRALTNAFMMDVFRDAPVKPTPEWLVNAPFMSIMNYKLFSYLILAPWNDIVLLKTRDQSSNAMLTKLLREHSSMFNAMIKGESAAELKTEAIDYVFDIQVQTLDEERAKARSARKPQKHVGDTTSEEHSGGRIVGFASTPAPGNPPNKPTTSGYVDSLFAKKPHLRQTFPWLQYWRRFGPSKWDQGNNQRADTAMFLSCLQEALFNLMQQKGPQGDASVIDFFFDNLAPGGDANQPSRMAFLKEVLIRLGRLLDERWLTTTDNPLKRRKEWYETNIMPMIEAEMMAIATTGIKTDDASDSEFRLKNQCARELQTYLEKHFNERIGEVETIGVHLQQEYTSLNAMKTANTVPPVPPIKTSLEPPSCLAKVKVELEQHQMPSSTTTVEAIPEWVESYWTRGRVASSLKTSQSELQWVTDFITATQGVVAAANADIQRDEGVISQLNAELQALTERMAQIQAELQQQMQNTPLNPAPIAPNQPVPSAYPLQEALQADLARLKTLEEQLNAMLETSAQQQGRAFDILQRSVNLIQKRADWSQAMESAFDYLRGFGVSGASWTQHVGTADAVAGSPNSQVRAAFAGLTRCFINTNEESTGSRGTYQQSIYYAHNMRHAGDYARTLLALDPQQAAFGGFVHVNIL